MDYSLDAFAFLIFAFLWGGIPTGYIVVKILKGIDIRTQGSGNIGATNVRRMLGTRWFVGVILLDAFKGALPMLAVSLFSDFADKGRVLTAACTIAGNLFSPWLGFKGGKGIGTGLGVFLILSPIPLLISFIIFWVILFTFNYVSVASVTAAVIFPIAVFSVELIRGVKHNWILLTFASLLVFALVLAHRANISRLVNGTETRFFSRQKEHSNRGIRCR